MKKKVSIVIAGMIGFLLVLYGVMKKAGKVAASIAVIGGADGPTSIFLAGKIGPDFGWITILIGVVIIALLVLFFARRKK